MISDAVTISKLVCLSGALLLPPNPVTILLNPLSNTSVTLVHVIPSDVIFLI